MDFDALTAKFGLYLGSVVIGFVSGLVPVVNSEIYLLAVSTLAGKPALLPVAALTSLGQMLGKTLLFYAGRGVIKIPTRKYENKMEAVKRKFEQWQHKTDLFIFLSAFAGFPPFYIVSVVGGAMNINFARFFVAGIIGRTIRFAVIVYFPQLVQGIIDANPDSG